MGKNIARDFERIRRWKDLLFGSAGMEDLVLKVEASGGIRAFQLSKRVTRELVVELYDVRRTGLFLRAEEDDWWKERATAVRNTFSRLVSETGWFDDFLKYALYICRGYLDPAENGWDDSAEMVGKDSKPELEELVSAIEEKIRLLEASPKPEKREKVSEPWLEDVPPVCLPECLADPFCEQGGQP